MELLSEAEGPDSQNHRRNKLDKTKVDQLAQDRFGKGVKQLNKLEASGLIEELLEQTGQSKPRGQRFEKAGAR